MCAGGAGVLGAISGVTNAVTGYGSSKAQYQQELAQNKILQMRADDDARVRRINAILQYQQLDQQAFEAAQSAASEGFKIRQEMTRAKALAVATATDAGGITGNTVERLKRQIAVEESLALGDVETNRQNAMVSINLQRQSVEAANQSAPVYTAISKKPSFGSMLLGATIGGLTGYYGAVQATNGGNAATSAQVSETASTTAAASAITPPAASAYQYRLPGWIAGDQIQGEPVVNLRNTGGAYQNNAAVAAIRR